MTGCSARMAVLYVCGEMKVGDKFAGTSIIETKFPCRTDSVGENNGKPTINPIISGGNWVVGIDYLIWLQPDWFIVLQKNGRKNGRNLVLSSQSNLIYSFVTQRCFLNKFLCNKLLFDYVTLYKD